jgi:glycosyltransferase involved in cell wall biosynthesis
MSRLHVLFVANVTSTPGGATGGQAVVAATLFRSRLATAVDLEPLATATPAVPPPPLPWRMAFAARRLARFVTRLWAADAVLVFAADTVSLLEKGWMCIIARLAGRGVVLRLSGGNLPAQCDTYPVLRAWLRLVLRSVHFICTQSPYWTTYFTRFPEARDKLLEVSNGLVIGAPPLSRQRPAAGSLVFVGWVTREKGVFEALEVFEGVRRLHPSATLTVVGGGRDVDAFGAAVRRRGLTSLVNALGWVDWHEVQRILRDSDIFLFPSHFEGLPNAVIEAMAAELPVVATRVGGVVDLIRHGENGFLVDVGDVMLMTSLVGDLLDRPDQAREMGLRARRTVAERCDIENVWPRYAEAIREAAARAGRDGTDARRRRSSASAVRLSGDDG